MNIELLDPFRQTVPDHIEATILHPSLTSPCNVLSHNNRGFYLAAGYSCGSVMIWCALSRCPLRFLEGLHTPSPLGPVSLAWSKDSRTLVTGGDDGMVFVLRLDERPVSALPVDACGKLREAVGGALALPGGADKSCGIKSVRLHPNDADSALVVTTCGHAFVLALGVEANRKGKFKGKGKGKGDGKAGAAPSLVCVLFMPGKQSNAKAADACFDRKGGLIFVAAAKVRNKR